MAWLVLLISAVLEAVWATALGYSDGFREPVPTTVFFAAAAVSLVGLEWAARRIAMGTAYAVWTGAGAALTVSYALLMGQESASVWKLVFLTGIVAGVAGLKMLPSGQAAADRRPRRVSIDHRCAQAGH